MLAELLSDPDVQAEFNAQADHDRIAQIAHATWVASAHRYQIPPPLEYDYTIWMMLAGRGAGKTRSAAEALWWWAWTHPESRCLVPRPHRTILSSPASRDRVDYSPASLKT